MVYYVLIVTSLYHMQLPVSTQVSLSARVGLVGQQCYMHMQLCMHLLDGNLLGCHVCTSGESVEECGCKGECVKYT